MGLQKYHVIYLNTPALVVFQKLRKVRKQNNFLERPNGQRLAAGCYQGIIARVSVFGFYSLSILARKSSNNVYFFQHGRDNLQWKYLDLFISQ